MAGSVAEPLESKRRMFESAQTHAVQEREAAQTDQLYYDGDQWTDEERKALKARKQPDTVFNRIRPAVNGIIGVIERGRSDPKAYPRTEKDNEASEVATDALRFVADRSRLQHIKLRAMRDFLVWGFCAAAVAADEQGECMVTKIRPEEFFYDPYSREEDFSDARFMGIAKWMDTADVAAMFPDLRDDIEKSSQINNVATFEDRPTGWAWTDPRRRRVMLVEMYYKESGVWQQAVFLHNVELVPAGPSPFLDDQGKPRNPIVAVAAYVDQDNRRYGVVRDMRGPQDAVNKGRSKGLHQLTMRQSRISRSVQDADEVRRQLARPDGIVQADKEEFDILSTSDMAAGHISLMQDAKAEIERMGPNPGVLGRDVQGQSGRAILAQQQAGLIELAPLFAAFDDWTLRMYRGVWSCIKQYWTNERWVRVTDDDDAPRFVGLNIPMEAMVDPMTGQQVVTKMQNPVAQMDVDITIESTPDTASLQQDQWQGLIELVQAGVPIPPDVIIEASNLPRKRQMLEKMRQPQQGPDPMQELAMRKGAADVRLTEAKAGEAEAKTAAMSVPQAMPEAMPMQQPDAGGSLGAYGY